MKINNSIKEFILIVCIMISVFLTIIPNAEVWNMAAMGYTDTFHVIVSVIDFIFEGTMIYFIAKYFFKKIKSSQK